MIDSTHQLIGKYLRLRNEGATNAQNAQEFFLWLKAKGITSHVNDIVEAVAEKVITIIYLSCVFFSILLSRDTVPHI